MNRVLLVEDDAGLRYAFSVALKREGLEVVEAPTGDEAVRRLRDDSPAYDCVVLDMIVPNVHGSSIIFNIAQTQPKLPVVAVTGFPDRVMFADPADRHVVKAIFVKPVDPNDVAVFVKARCQQSGN